MHDGHRMTFTKCSSSKCSLQQLLHALSNYGVVAAAVAAAAAAVAAAAAAAVAAASSSTICRALNK